MPDSPMFLFTREQVNNIFHKQHKNIFYAKRDIISSFLFVFRPIDIMHLSVTIPHCYTVNAHCGKIDVLSPAGVCNGRLEVVFTPLVLPCFRFLNSIQER